MARKNPAAREEIFLRRLLRNTSRSGPEKQQLWLALPKGAAMKHILITVESEILSLVAVHELNIARAI